MLAGLASKSALRVSCEQRVLEHRDRIEQTLDRHLIRAQQYRDLRVSAFAEWNRAVA